MSTPEVEDNVKKKKKGLGQLHYLDEEPSSLQATRISEESNSIYTYRYLDGLERLTLGIKYPSTAPLKVINHKPQYLSKNTRSSAEMISLFYNPYP